MEKERDVRLVRFDLRLRVGADGDPLDNELHNAWSALPENTVIRNDWLRRRLLLGHILEREGLTELLSVIGRLTGNAAQTPSRPAEPAPPARRESPAVADFLPPADEPQPAPEARKPSAKRQLGGLLPTIAPVEKKEKDGASADNAAQSEPKAKATGSEPAPRPQQPEKSASGETRAEAADQHQQAAADVDKGADTPAPESTKTSRPALAGDRS